MKREIHFDLGRMTVCGVPLGACSEDMGFLQKVSHLKDEFGEMLMSNYRAGTLKVRLSEGRITAFVFLFNVNTHPLSDDVGWWLNGERIHISADAGKESVIDLLGPFSRKLEDDSDTSLIFLRKSSDCEILWDSQNEMLKAIYLALR